MIYKIVYCLFGVLKKAHIICYASIKARFCRKVIIDK